MVKLYAQPGYIVRVTMMDQEFDKVEEACNTVEINTTAAREHVGDIKRYIRTIKERGRAIVLDLPYKNTPSSDHYTPNILRRTMAQQRPSCNRSIRQVLPLGNHLWS